MNIDRQSFKLLVFASTLAVLVNGSLVFGQTPQPWSWGQPESFHSGLTKLDVLLAGRVQEVRTTEEVQVYRRDAGFGVVRVYDVEALAVIQGTGIRPNDVISVVVIPRMTDIVNDYGGPPPGWSHAEVMEHHRRTGRFPAGIVFGGGGSPSLQPGEEWFFALFKPEIRTDYKTIVWSGEDSLRRIPNLYGLTLSRPLREDGRDVEVLTRYLEIEAIRDVDERIRRLAEYSLNLVRDPEVPEEIGRGAVRNFGRRYLETSWGVRTVVQTGGRLIQVPHLRHTAEYLDDEETAELVALAVNPQTPRFLRRRLIRTFESIEGAAEWKPGRFDAADFLPILKDRSQEYSIRNAAFSLLEKIGGAEVKQAFQEMLHLALTRDAGEDQRLLSSIRLSRLLREDP